MVMFQQAPVLLVQLGLTLLCSIDSTAGILHVYPTRNSTPEESVYYDEPLFLSRYIENGKIEEGQRAARVEPLVAGIVSYSGFFTVNKEYNSNLFFWFFPAEVDPNNAPLVIWLQGGPGASSLYGLFEENGPFYIDKNYKLIQRDYYWSKTLNVIYIDNPVGTGFSFTNDDRGYATNQLDVGRDLYEALQQFLIIFPQYNHNDLYIAGESYAGKYVPALAHTIHEFNKLERSKINLKGIAIGDGLIDPETMINYADYLYEIGLIDSNTKEKMRKMQKITVDLIRIGQFELATEMFGRLILGGTGNESVTTLFAEETGFSYYFDFRHYKDDSTHGDIDTFVNMEKIRTYLHVGNLTNQDGSLVNRKLKADISKSVKPWLEVLLEHYRVVLYNGQLDIIIPYPLSLNCIKSLKWSGAEEYKVAKRKQWYVNDELAGYTKTVGKFTEILVRNAGHMVPMDQPKWAFDLITHVTSGIPF